MVLFESKNGKLKLSSIKTSLHDIIGKFFQKERVSQFDFA